MKEKALRLLKAPAFSPAGLLVRGLVIALLFFLAHVAGLRDYATVLSGALPSETVSPVVALPLGMGYVLLYFAFVILAPILVIAAALLAAGWSLVRALRGH